jgi:hypothetical protein
LSHLSGASQNRLLRGEFFNESNGLFLAPRPGRQAPPMMSGIDDAELAFPFGIEKIFPLFRHILGRQNLFIVCGQRKLIGNRNRAVVVLQALFGDTQSCIIKRPV